MKAPAKTSKTVARLAADYLNLTEAELVGKAVMDPAAFLRDVRKLAGSVLRQAEGDNS